MTRAGGGQVLRDPTADEILRRRGVTTLPMLDREQVRVLRCEVDDLGLAGRSGFYDTAAAALTDSERQSVHDLLWSRLGPLLRLALVGYRPVMSALINKWPDPQSRKDLHRDLRVVDERHHRAVCVWMPLVDVDEGNGALSVLPGSHLVETSLRSVPRTPSQPTDPMHDLTFDDLETVPLKAGEAVVFDLALIHGSDVNRTDDQRPAVGVALVPDEAPISILYCHPDDRVEVLQVPRPDALRQIAWAGRPTGLPAAGIVCSRPAPMSPEELLRRSRAVAADPGDSDDPPSIGRFAEP